MNRGQAEPGWHDGRSDALTIVLPVPTTLNHVSVTPGVTVAAGFAMGVNTAGSG
jgi:hypothetical protein